MKNAMNSLKLDQQTIVTILFGVILVVFAFWLPGFTSTGNLLALVRSVSVLGILGLGMAIVVIGRGIDLSMIATLAVPASLVMTRAAAGPLLALSIPRPNPSVRDARRLEPCKRDGERVGVESGRRDVLHCEHLPWQRLR